MQHRKEYIGKGVVLFCGDTIIASHPTKDANWHHSKCRYCGMDVETTGNGPETDSIIERTLNANH